MSDGTPISTLTDIPFTTTTETLTFTTVPPSDTTTQVIVSTYTITDEVEYLSFLNVAQSAAAAAKSAHDSSILGGGGATGTGTGTGITTSASASPHGTGFDSPSESPRASNPGLSLGAKVGIGVVIPIATIVAGLIMWYCFRRRRRSMRDRSNVETSYQGEQKPSYPAEQKPELYAGPADPAIAGPVYPKAELSAKHQRTLPPELHDTMIAEADARAETVKKVSTGRKPLAMSSITSSQDGLGRTPFLTGSHTDAPSRTTTTQSGDAAYVEEADAAVQELGLLSMRKKTLIAQASALGKKPEEVEGRKGEEYRQLVQREERVRARLEEIEDGRGA